MGRNDSDSQLIAAYRRGGVAALEELVERYRKPLYGFILNMSGRREDADEVFQEVWFRAIRKISDYRDDNLCGWLMRIAHNLMVDRSRRRKPVVSLEDDRFETGRALADTLHAAGPGPATQIAAEDTGRRIEEGVALLPEAQREVFLLRVEADLSFKEIARLQGVSTNTALARMQYAIGKLRDFLKDDYRELTG